MENDTNDGPSLVALTAEIVEAYSAGNHLSGGQLVDLIASVHAGLAGLGDAKPAEEPTTEHAPAVTVRKSLSSPDHLISLIDGKPYQMLKRHLAKHGLTPVDYRTRFGLKPDYPMTAPAYSARRSGLAKAIGLGRKVAAEVKPAASAPKRRTLKLR